MEVHAVLYQVVPVYVPAISGFYIDRIILPAFMMPEG